METRRRVPRHDAGWTGICLIEDDVPVTDWRECDVLDISMLGLALAVADHRVDDLIGRNISVEFPAVSDSVSVCLDGIIRNARRIDARLVRLGVEFVGMSTVEQAIATVLGALIEIDGPASLVKL
jgi:hypothetical protein